MASGWGPIHLCQGGCGHEVQRNGYRLYDAGTDNRHRCPRHLDSPPEIRFLECLCGTDVDEVDGVRYLRGTSQLHVCGLAPKPKPTLAIVRKPSPPVAPPNVERTPVGVFRLE